MEQRTHRLILTVSVCVWTVICCSGAVAAEILSIIENGTRVDPQPVTTVSTTNDANIPVNQTNDIGGLLQVIPDFTHAGDTKTPVTQANDISDLLPMFTDVKHVEDVAKPVNQEHDSHHLLNIFSDGKHVTDVVKQGIKVKDSDVLPIFIDVQRVGEVVKPLNQANDSGLLPKHTVVQRVGEIVKPVNQAKDNDLVPIFTDAKHVGEVEQPVNQATDSRDLVPVFTDVKHVWDVNNGSVFLVDITPTPPLFAIEDNTPQDNSNSFSSIGTLLCAEKGRCNTTEPSKRCLCDRVCGVLQDCCEDAAIVYDANLTLDQFTCTYIDGLIDDSKGYMMVTKCSSDWDDDFTKGLCEHAVNSDDIISRVPVSDMSESGFIFKNKHCAHCNYVYEYEFWRARVLCQDDSNGINITDTENCDLLYERANEFSPFRKCTLYSDITLGCPMSYTVDEVKEKCNSGTYSIVYDTEDNTYRNKYCAICNGIDVERLFCEPQSFSVHAATYIPPGKWYSFRMLVDFNSKWTVNDREFRKPFSNCNDNEIFDPLVRKCREILCPHATSPSQGKCTPDPPQLLSMPTIHSVSFMEAPHNEIRVIPTNNCTLTKLDKDEFEFLNATAAIKFRELIFNETEYVKNGSDVFVCLEKTNIDTADKLNGTFKLTLYHFDEVESYVSLVGVILSILASSITLMVYIIFPQLLNTPGKNIMCLIISLIIAQIIFLVAANVAELPNACVAFAILMHYFFLCAFCWMNVIAFDVWMAFSHKFVSQRNTSGKSKRFYIYSLYAWCLPLFIVGVAISAEYTSAYESYRPRYGDGVCWIASRYALLLFFAGPLGVLKLFDFVSFGFTVYHISNAKRQGALVRKGQSTNTFLINIRLSLVMGLTWAFAFVANFTNNSAMWYMFILFNTLQGVFIALSFLCTRKVLNLFREKYTHSSSMGSGSTATHSTKSTE